MAAFAAHDQDAKHAQANARLADFFDHVVPRVLLEVSEPTDDDRRLVSARKPPGLLH